jgi:hypothetical protein
MRNIIILSILFCSSIAQGQFIKNTGISLVNTGSLVATGDWVSDAGSSTKNEGTITVTDTWTNNGSLTGRGGFVLNYATDKSFKAGNPTIGFLKKTGVGAALVNGSLYPTDSLVLLNGAVKMNATDTVVIRNTRITATPTSYIEGLVAHIGTGDRLFPLGKDGRYLPVKLIKLNASRATASVANAPTDYSAGAGVESLIAFPYVWKITKKVAADTATYVEVGYPTSLVTAANPILTRETPGKRFTSMGARTITTANSRTNVVSYSRGLTGTFTIARGFPGNLRTDSLALVALYNNTVGASWTNKTSWLTGTIDKWFGVTLTGQSITAIALPNNKLAGPVPDLLTDIQALQTINLSTNSITAIPNFSESKQLTTLNISNNKLEFGSLEPNKSLVSSNVAFNYANQADIGTPTTTLVDVGSSPKVIAQTGGTNQYQWKRNGIAVAGATSKEYEITSIGKPNMGEYVAEISNTSFPGLLIKTAPNKVLATSTLNGKLFATAGNAANKGIMKLLKKTTVGGYDTVATKAINADGTYKLEKVVLDDYQLNGFVDTLTYKGALPTWFTNTIYWEEANTIAVEGNVDNLNITSNYKPVSPPKGQGIIKGTVTDLDNSGRLEKEKRVKGCGVSVRKVRKIGRTTDEELTLVAYVFSNENGEFTLPELPAGDYRPNIQYPGYPMDLNSFINITIGEGLKSSVVVAAEVDKGQIKVKKLVVTGDIDRDEYAADVFPNPSADYIQLRFDTPSEARTVRLTDLTGKVITLQAATSIESTIDVTALSTGIYLLEIKEKDQVMKTLRVMKE